MGVWECGSGETLTLKLIKLIKNNNCWFGAWH